MMKYLNETYKKPTVFIVYGKNIYRPKSKLARLKLRASYTFSLREEVYDILPQPGELLIQIDTRQPGVFFEGGKIIVPNLEKALEIYDELLRLGFD